MYFQVQDVVAWYSVSFKDPLILNPPAWYTSFVLCEMFLQLPFFFVATYAFWKGKLNTAHKLIQAVKRYKGYLSYRKELLEIIP